MLSKETSPRHTFRNLYHWVSSVCHTFFRFCIQLPSPAYEQRSFLPCIYFIIDARQARWVGGWMSNAAEERTLFFSAMSHENAQHVHVVLSIPHSCSAGGLPQCIPRTLCERSGIKERGLPSVGRHYKLWRPKLSAAYRSLVLRRLPFDCSLRASPCRSCYIRIPPLCCAGFF